MPRGGTHMKLAMTLIMAMLFLAPTAGAEETRRDRDRSRTRSSALSEQLQAQNPEFTDQDVERLLRVQGRHRDLTVEELGQMGRLARANKDLKTSE